VIVMKKTAKPVNRKEYGLAYKKKSSSGDPYGLTAGLPELSACERCHNVYRNKRWYEDASLYADAMKNPSVGSVLCPACRKILQNFPGGIVTLKGDYFRQHQQDLMNLIRNEEKRARGFNPLERLMSVKENEKGNMVVSTTTEKLAQRLGRAIKKAFHGEVAYQWSHDNKLVRVEWVRENA
jgi:NMD protein affecting ribosome stability and mRNA decay